MPLKINQKDVDYFYDNIYSNENYNTHPLCDFLEAVFTIYKKVGPVVNLSDIANHLNITQGYTSIRVKNLCQLNVFKKTKNRHFETTSSYEDYKKNILVKKRKKKEMDEDDENNALPAFISKSALIEQYEEQGLNLLALTNDFYFVSSRVFNGILDNCIRYGSKDKRRVIENEFTYGSTASGYETLFIKAACMSNEESEIYSIADLRYIRNIDTMISTKLYEIFKNDLQNDKPLDFSMVLKHNSFVIDVADLTRRVGLQKQTRNNINTVKALHRLEDTRFDIDATRAPNFVALLTVARTLIGDTHDLDFKEMKKPKIRYFQSVEHEKEYEDLFNDDLMMVPQFVHVRLDPLHLGLICLGLMRRNNLEAILHANHSGIEKEGGIISKIYNTAGSILRPSKNRDRNLVIKYTWSDFADKFASNQDRSNVYRDFMRVYSKKHDEQHGVGLFQEYSANLPVSIYGYIFHWEGRPEVIMEFHNSRKKRLHRNKRNSKTYKPIISISRDPDDNLIGDNSFSATMTYVNSDEYEGIDEWEPPVNLYDQVKIHGIPKAWFDLERDLFILERRERRDDDHIIKSSEMNNWIKNSLLKKWKSNIAALDQWSDPVAISRDWMPAERVIEDLTSKGFEEQFIKEKAIFFRDNQKSLSRTWNQDFIAWMDKFNFSLY